MISIDPIWNIDIPLGFFWKNMTVETGKCEISGGTVEEGISADLATLGAIFAKYPTSERLQTAARRVIGDSPQGPVVLSSNIMPSGGDLLSITENKRRF